MKNLFALALLLLSAPVSSAADVPGRWTRIGPDGGASWTLAGSGLGRVATFNGLAVDAALPDTVYASTDNGLFTSANGGVSWRMISLPEHTGGTMAVAADPRRPGVVYTALNPRGIRWSTDRGRTWKILIGPPDIVRVLAIDPLTPTTLYAGTLTSGVYKSTDGGVRWKVITPESSKRPGR